jgi:hypothetical protein
VQGVELGEGLMIAGLGASQHSIVATEARIGGRAGRGVRFPTPGA